MHILKSGDEVSASCALVLLTEGLLEETFSDGCAGVLHDASFTEQLVDVQARGRLAHTSRQAPSIPKHCFVMVESSGLHEFSNLLQNCCWMQFVPQPHVHIGGSGSCQSTTAPSNFPPRATLKPKAGNMKISSGHVRRAFASFVTCAGSLQRALRFWAKL